MKTWNGYVAGANLGHWLSQYGKDPQGDPEQTAKQEEHFRSYIREEDFCRMRSWGLDHVRVPVDYFFFESDRAPGVYSEQRLAMVDRTLGYCKKYGLNMILDLHHAPGFTFNNGFDKTKNNLFYDRDMQGRFIAIWEMFACRAGAGVGTGQAPDGPLRTGRYGNSAHMQPEPPFYCISRQSGRIRNRACHRSGYRFMPGSAEKPV